MSPELLREIAMMAGGRRSRWGSRERMGYSIMRYASSVMCSCGKVVTLRTVRPFWETETKVTCQCGREHRMRIVVQSRKGRRR